MKSGLARAGLRATRASEGSAVEQRGRAAGLALVGSCVERFRFKIFINRTLVVTIKSVNKSDLVSGLHF